MSITINSGSVTNITFNNIGELVQAPREHCTSYGDYRLYSDLATYKGLDNFLKYNDFSISKFESVHSHPIQNDYLKLDYCTEPNNKYTCYHSKSRIVDFTIKHNDKNYIASVKQYFLTKEEFQDSVKHWDINQERTYQLLQLQSFSDDLIETDNCFLIDCFPHKYKQKEVS